jgi:GNAT superfamily N-acetyltransferase
MIVIPTLTDWYQSEWEPYYGKDGPGDARADLESRCNRDELPIGLVAIENNQVLGTAALDLDVTTDLKPSVVGLLVAPAYRRQGIATALLNAAEDLARQLGYSRLFVSTTVLGDLLNQLGWEAMGAVQFLNAEPGSVYVCDL